MASIKRGTLIASILLVVAVIISACDLRYSTPPAATNTPMSQNFFSTPIAQTPGNMSDVEVFGTGTALALTGSPVPGAATNTPAGVTPQAATSTPTPAVNVPTNPSLTPTATLAVSGPTATLIPSGSRPATYTLQSGEFPYCIARRFNVDPDELLAASGLTSAQADSLSAGTVLKIPQTGNPFPGSRMRFNHPDTYTVDSSSETIYGIACYYGDIDPALIAQTNGLSVNASLTVGQKLTIP